MSDDRAMELEEAAANGTLAQVRISVVTENAEGGRSRSQQPAPPRSDWDYLAELRLAAEPPPQSAGGTAAAAAAALTPELPQADRYGADGPERLRLHMKN